MTSNICQSSKTQPTRQPLLRDDKEKEMENTLMEGGVKNGPMEKTKNKKSKSDGKKEKKGGCCSKKKKYKEIVRNKKMFYKQFGKKRKLLRCKKILKNIFIGSLVLGLTYLLLQTNLMRFTAENCKKAIDPTHEHSENHNGHSKNTIVGKAEQTVDESRAVICYQTIYNYLVLSLIQGLCVVWLTFKILKADMGFRCTSSPCFSQIVSGIMAIVRFFTFFVGFGYFIFPFMFWHCLFTYSMIWEHIKKLFLEENKGKQIKEVSNQLFMWNNFIHFQCAMLWIFSIILYTSMPCLLIYSIVVLRRKSDFRQGWARRFDMAMLKLMRIFLGTSRLMVVHYERHDELTDAQSNPDFKNEQPFESRDFLGEDYSNRSAGNFIGTDSGIINKREKLQQFVEKCSKSKDTHKFKFLEGRDCPICLAQFKDEDTVIQLRCHKFHVYHEQCLNEMMNFTEIEYKCLMCRNPILNHEYDIMDWVQ